MTKEITNKFNNETFKIGGYIVVLTRINNDINGNPRFEASITNIEKLITRFYRFTGHFMGLRDEAQYILNYSMEAL